MRDFTAFRESEIERVLASEVKKLGGAAYKWVSPGNAGVPDRIVVFPGRPPVFAELKTDRGKLTKTQEAQIGRLKKLGQEVAVIYGMDGLSRFFRAQGYRETGEALDRRYGM